MGFRDRLRGLIKGMIPAPIQAAQAAAQMTPQSPFSPGTPITPFDGYGRTPRAHDFPTGVNINPRPRAQARIGFSTLAGLIDAYDVAQTCIWHRIDSIRSLDWKLIAAEGYQDDITDAIATAKGVLKKPDRRTPFNTWLAMYMYDVLAFDAGTLYRTRNKFGQVNGLMVVDGQTIAPLLDYWGRRPMADSPDQPEPPAYVQYAEGLVWDWLFDSDLIYVPFRQRPGTPYGLPPLETILLNANTDLRFQKHFLERFTEGNIPEVFATAPESWSPQEIEDWQALWDAFMRGDQAVKSMLKWIPGGTGIVWSSEKEFTDDFSLFLMRKTCAAFHIVPSDLGFTETVNLSSSESQGDVGHRVGDLPLIRHLQAILTAFLQDDLGLPLQFAFDLGEEQEDRLAQAQSDQIYIDEGVVGLSEIREMRFGLTEPGGRPMPRFIKTARSGPIPLISLLAVAGNVDQETGAPALGTPLPHTAFAGVEGVMPNPPLQVPALAVQEYGPAALPPAPPQQQPPADAALVTKDADSAPAAADTTTAGITTATGITSVDLIGRHDDEDNPKEQGLAKAELAAFRQFRSARRQARTWRDFPFRHMPTVTGVRLNQAGRAMVRKDAGEIAVAGLAVQAADTGRVLMIQRALDPEDPAAGFWEFPGGHLEDGETPLAAAAREWGEETGCTLPYNPEAAAALAFGDGPGWTSGIYQGFVYSVSTETAVPVSGTRDQIVNPDDPDGDQIEALAWWDPAQLAGNPAVRPELLDTLPDVLTALRTGAADAEATCPCGLPAAYDDIDGWQHTDGSISHDDGESVSDKMTRQVVKGGDGGGPKGSGRGADGWPGWQLDQQCADHWAPLIATAAASALTVAEADRIAAAFATSGPAIDPEAGRREAVDMVAAWLADQGLDPAGPLAQLLPGVVTDGYLIGVTCAHARLDGTPPPTGGWTPGDTTTARDLIGDLGAGDDLAQALNAVPDLARSLADGYLHDVARELLDTADLAVVAKGRIGDALRRRLGNIRRATGTAISQVTRASGPGALFGYQQRDVAMGQWLIDPSGNVCPVCEANAAAGLVPLGQPFPSGDTCPPAHDHCRCALANA